MYYLGGAEMKRGKLGAYQVLWILRFCLQKSQKSSRQKSQKKSQFK